MVINEYNENKRKTIIIDKLKSVNPQKNKISKSYDKISIQNTCDGTIYYQNNNIVAHNLLFHITLYSHVDVQNSKKTRQRV